MTTVATIRSAAPSSFRSALFLLFATLLALAPSGLRAQTYLSEDFESGLPSSNFTDVGNGVGWQTNSTYFYAGAKAAWFQTNSGNSAASNDVLQSRTINLSGSTRPLLTFQHISATERSFDQCIVEVSTDNGVTWVIPSNTQYNGNSFRKTGAYPQAGTTATYVDGPFFDAESRPEWDVRFTGTGSSPTTGQSLWGKEVFDLSAYRTAGVKIRFRVKSNGSNDYFGWLIDNVQIAEAPTTPITGTRLIGTGGYTSFRAAAQALADSGVGTGGVTILAAAGTYTDSLVIGNYRGVSASNRVVFKSQSGPSSVIIQRNGNPNFSGQPGLPTGYSYTQYPAAVVLMSGAQFTTFSGITVQQMNVGTATNYYCHVGFYLTNGCRFDSIYQCTANLQSKYYFSVGMIVGNNMYRNSPLVPNVSNKLVNDTIIAWNGVMFYSNFNATSVLDSNNELNATTQGATFLNLGVSSTSQGVMAGSFSTAWFMSGYGEANLLINNVKASFGWYYNAAAGSTYFQYYGFYGGSGNLINPILSNNLFTNIGKQPAGSAYTQYGNIYGYGYYLSGNTVINAKVLNNTISDTWEYYPLYKFYFPSCVAPLVQGNTITRLNCYYDGGYIGFYFPTTFKPRVIGNRIKDIRFGCFTSTSASTFYGIQLNGCTGGVVCYDNMISDIKFNYTSAVSGNTIYGIYYSGPSPGTPTGLPNAVVRDSICHNTVWFDMQSGASSPAYGYTTYDLYFSPSATAGVECYVYNNIFGNRTQTTGVAGYYQYGIYHASTSGTSYIDFNDFYVNTLGSGSDPYHVTGYYGGNYCLLSDYKTATSTYAFNNHSFVEQPPFNSTDSLNLTSGSTSRLWRAGKPLATIPTDFNGAARNVAPTIGACEGSLVASSTDDVGPGITYTRVSKTQGTGAVTVTATITDPSGVNTSTYPPLLYYKASTSGTWSSSAYSSSSGSTFNFTIPSQSLGTKIQFYIAAQDLATTPNGSTYPNGGLGTNPPGSTAPGNTNYATFWDTCSFVSPLNGDYLIAGTGANYPSLKAALDAIEVGGVSGPVRLLINTSTLTETGLLQLNGPILGSSPTNTITIKPNTGFTPQVNIQTTVAVSYGLVINGVSNVIIDGSNTSGGSTRDMTWQGGTNSSSANNLVQFFIQPGISNVDGSPINVSNITIKNMNIRGGYNSSLTSALSDYGILLQGSNNGNFMGAVISDVTLTNNSISQVANAVRLLVPTPDLYVSPLKRITVTNNLIGPGAIGTDSVCSTGILTQGVDSVTIDNNDVQRLYEGTGSANLIGYQEGTGTSNLKFTRNKIHNVALHYTSGSEYGIFVSTSWPPNSNNLYANNMIYDFHATYPTYSGGTSAISPAAAGIFVSTGYGPIFTNNSVNFFDTSFTTTYTGAQYTEAFGLNSGAYDVIVENNIFSNRLIIGQTYGFNIGYMTYYGAGDIKQSDYNIISAQGSHGFQGYDYSRSKYVGTFDSLKMMTSGDVHSWPQAQTFTSNTDAHLSTSVPTRAESGAIPVSGVTIDIDGDSRNATTPDIGADEGNFPTANVDVAINTVSLPATKFVAGGGVRPVISVTNFGIQNAYSIPVVQTVFDSNSASLVTINGTIDSVRAGETRTITIDSVTYAGARHTFFHRIYLNYATDALRTNDSSGILRITTVAALNGLYTVGSGQWAPTIKAAFDSLVNNGILGNVTFRLTDATYNETAFNTGYIGSGGVILGAGPSARLRIKPAPGVSPTINIFGTTGAVMSTNYSTAVYPGFGFLNTSYLTLDGSNTENGTSKNTYIRYHPNVSGSAFYGLVFSSTNADSVKNFIMWDSVYTATSQSSSGAPSDYGFLITTSNNLPTVGNVIYNNTITDNYYNMYIYGATAGLISNTVIRNNLFNHFWYYNVYHYQADNTSFIGNEVRNDTVVYTATYSYGIYATGGTTTGINISNNRMWHWRTMGNGTPYFYPIYLGGVFAGTGTIANNVILMEHDTTTASNYVWGCVQLAQSGGFVNVVYNTLYAGGAIAANSGYVYGTIYRTNSGDCLIKNNIMVCDRAYASTPNYAFYGSTVTGNVTLNNNIYYCGNTYGYDMYWNGSLYTPLSFSTYQSTYGQDAKSWLENPPFLDTLGGNFNLATNIATRVESHGTPIPGITTDFNGNTRNASYPDIGAFEGNYTPEFNVDAVAVSMLAPTAGTHYYSGTSIAANATFRNGGVLAMSNTPITYQALDASGTVQATLVTSISSMSVGGVPTSAGQFNFVPNSGGTWTVRAFATATNEEFTLDDTVKVTINVTVGLAGNYNVGVGQYAPTVKAAFDSLARNGAVGAVNFMMTDNAYNEPSITGNQFWSESASTPVTFKPISSAVTPVVIFTPTAARPWGIRLNSMPNITFDGSNTTGGTTRNTTWQFASGNTFGQALFWAADSLGGNGANSFTVKNARIISTGTASNIYGVYAGGTTISSISAGSNNSVTVQNNEIRNAGYGVFVNGNTASPNTGLVVNSNQIGPLVGDNTLRIGSEGVRIAGSTGNTISGNEITGLYSNTGGVAAIDLVAAASGGTISANKLHDIEAAGATSGAARGIVDNGGGSVTMYNNMIWHVIGNSSTATNAGADAGIYLGASAGDQLYFNSVGLTGNRDTTGAPASTGNVSAGLYMASTASGVTLKNNIFGNLQTEAARGRQAYGYALESAGSLAASSNNNVSGAGVAATATNALIAGTSYTRMLAIQTALGGGKEANSFTPKPAFISDANLHVNTAAPTLIESGGLPIAGITTDIDGDVRNVSTPDVGADEGNFLKAVDVIGVSIDFPLNTAAFRPGSPTTAPLVTFRNGAAGSGTSIPVTLVTVDSLSGSKSFSNKTIPTLGPGASVQVTFDSLVLPDISHYGLYAYSNYIFDVDNSNDTTGAIMVQVCQPLTGTYNVGVGKDFPTLGIAAKALHDCGVQQRVNLVLTDASYNESAPFAFTGITGLSGANTLSIKPAPGVSPVMNITSSNTLNYGILLDSASWTIFDGSNVPNGTTRNWTINLTGSNSNASVILSRDGSIDTIKNMTLRNVAMTGGAGITVGPTRAAMKGTTILNNDIATAASGIVFSTTAIPDSVVTIRNNTITGFSAFGIQIGDMVRNVMIRNNSVTSGATTAASTSMTGIAVTGPNTGNVELGANKVMDFATSGTNPVLMGIVLSNTGPGGNDRIYDNWVSLGRQTALPTATLYGIQINTGASMMLQSNTFVIGGTNTGSGSSYAMWMNAPVNFTFVNNIFYNGRTNSTGTGSHYAGFGSNPPTGTGAAYNDDWSAPGVGGMLLHYASLDLPTLVRYRMLTNGLGMGMEWNSISEVPNFVGTSDLHIVTTVPNRLVLGGSSGWFGANGVPDMDIDGNPRPFNTPCIGACEFTGPRNARLSGSYTINPAAGNYPSLVMAIQDLNRNGVDGAVDLYMPNGIDTTSYPIVLVPADGINPNAPVRIHPALNGNSTLVGTAPNNVLNPLNLAAVVVFDSAANNITIDGLNSGTNTRRSMTIVNATQNFANSAVLMTNGASFNTVQNANLSTWPTNNTIQPTTDGWGVMSLVDGVSGYGGSLKGNYVNNDSISNGWNGVYASGAATWAYGTRADSNLIVRASKIMGFNSTGIYFGPYTTGALADGNYITTTSASGAVSMAHGNSSGKNYVDAVGNNTVRGIRLSSDNNSSGNTAGQNWIINLRSNGTADVTGIEVTGGRVPFIVNNFIALADNTSGSVRGIDEASGSGAGSAHARIFFNSINLFGSKNDGSAADYGISVLSPDGIGNGDSVYDNIIAINRNSSSPNTMYALAGQVAADFDVVDYNDYFTPHGEVAQIGSVSFPTLASLKAIPSWSGRDANTITGDPKWTSMTDLHLASYTSSVFYKGLYLSSVQNDIDYEARQVSPKPEIGADENAHLGTLPVELVSLTANGADSKVDLSFQTASEKNVFGFAVLRTDRLDHDFAEIASAYTNSSLKAAGKNGANGSDYAFVDDNVTNGTTYYYKIVGIDNDGTRETFDRIADATPMAPVEGFSIVGHYPNPFSSIENGAMKITYAAGGPSSKVELTITDLMGRVVRTLADGPIESAGTFTAEWDGRDVTGALMPSGTYLATLHTAVADGRTTTATVKVVLTK